MLNFSFEYPSYFLIFAAIIAAGLALLLYYKDTSLNEPEKWKIRLLFFLRFAFIFLILALLLNPIVRRISIIESKPIIVFAQDNSESVLLNRDSAFYKNEYLNEVHAIIDELSTDFDVRFLKFSDRTEQNSVIDFSGDITNISAVFRDILTRYAGMNLGAVILATDGIYNQGMNPVYSRHIRYPVYSIALGDTVQQKDIILNNVLHNQIAFYGNKFPVRLYISAEKCEEETTELSILRNEQTIYSKEISLPETGDVKILDLEILADSLGLQNYEAVLDPVEGEISIENNRASFVVDVIDKRRQLLLLADAPHPDIGALRFALKDNPNFDITIRYIKDFNENISDFDVIILHQLPSVNNPASDLLATINENNIPCLFVLGSKTSVSAFNALNAGVQISGTNALTDARGSISEDFLQFEAGPELSSLIDNAPPLRVFFGDYNYTENLHVLMYQVINNVETDKPLIAFIDRFEYKNGFVFGEGIWRWRVTDFRYFSSHSNFKDLVNKMIQYLSVVRIDQRLLTDYKRIYNENEAVIINAELYNEAFELVPNQDVRLILKDEDENEFSYFFRDYGRSYRLELSGLSPGKYSFFAEVEFDGSIFSSEGEFFVQEINMESLVTLVNHNILHRLARDTDAKVFFPDNMRDIPNFLSIDENIVTVAHQEERSLNISDLYYLFFIILAFAGTEWFLRKFWGGY